MDIKFLAGTAGALAVAATAAAVTPTDFDHDGKCDPGVYHATSGVWSVAGSLSSAVSSENWGWRESRPVPQDYDGDGVADLAVYHRQTSNWFIRLSSTSAGDVRQFGIDQGRPVPADYDHDGKADLALYQWLTGTWHIWSSSSDAISDQQFGWRDARPIPEDYDGDGGVDLAVYHRETGNWYLQQSTDGFAMLQFGWRDVRPVPRDYDGDHKADLAVYHQASGNWYIRRSSDGQTIVQNWGWYEAQPVPEDYDGDGLCDLAVYHRRTGTWFIRQSSTGTLRTFNLGGPDYCPLAAYRDGGIENLVILAFGDSITYGMGSSAQDPRTGYPILLERVLEPLLGGHCITINEGDPGESTGDGKARLKSLLQVDQPDLTLVMEGVNDTFYSKPNSTIESNLKSMIGACKSDGSAVILSTLTPVIKSAVRDRTEQEKRIESFNPRVSSIASSTGVQYVDNWAAITSQPNWQADYMEQRTANHPNNRGYAVMRDAWLKRILQGELGGLYY